MNKMIIFLCLAAMLPGLVSFNASKDSTVHKMRIHAVHINITVGGNQIGHGSGVFLEKGKILSCHHLLKDGADYRIVDFFGNSHKVIQVRSSKFYDLAILCIDPNEVPDVITGVEFGEVHVGDTVYAIGSPLTEKLYGTLTKGIVSSIRDGCFGENKLLQHDASINPGNSGGPLFNEEGELVGINELLVVPQVMQWCGIGLAIHYDPIKEFYEKYQTGEFDPLTLGDIYEKLLELL